MDPASSRATESWQCTPTGSTFTPKRISPVKLPDLSPEAERFLGDFANYLPLGCLSFNCSIGNTEPLLDDDNISPYSALNHLLYLQKTIDTDDVLSSSISLLAAGGWIRVELLRHETPGLSRQTFRIYLLPADVGVRYVDRNGVQSKRLYAALELLLLSVDIDPNMWNGRSSTHATRRFDTWATAEEGSLYYIFNTLKSPAPCVNDIPKEKRYTREALEDLLEPTATPGLKTILMPYQRRSAGLMLQREAAPKLELDPRLERRIAPDGSVFYYNPRDLLFLRDPVYLETCRGGILAETMGLGKTVMLLALILATKHHPPTMPEGHVPLQHTGRRGAALLSQLAVSAINRKGIPWKVELDRISQATGNDDMERYSATLRSSPMQYEVMTAPTRWNRNTMLPAPKKLTMAATTIIVVPQNLCKQWRSEIDKHVYGDSLRVLVLETRKHILPGSDILRTYDVLLFSRSRFDFEVRDGQDTLGRVENQRVCRCPYIGATRARDCTCVRSADIYDSPLKYLHFKRLIIDEGHFFSNSGSNAVLVANKLITVDHRWVVSGTPAKNLLGVEVDPTGVGTSDSHHAILHQRRKYGREDKDGAIKSIASLAQQFLRVRPWVSASDGQRAEWDEHIFRHETLKGRSYSAFSICLRQTLESMIIKTQPHDVEKDLNLPPLNHQVIYLEPSFYDKVTANIFTIMLIANAVASERTDADYLFHKNSGKARHELVSNLRQSAFFWTGFSEKDITAMVDNSEIYLNKDNSASTEDRHLLLSAMQFARLVLSIHGWKAMSKSHELGMFLENWPESSAEHWAFDNHAGDIMTGISPLLEAQKHVNHRTLLKDPGEGLAGAGIRALSSDSTSKVEVVVKGSSRRKKDVSTVTSPKKRKASQKSGATTAEPLAVLPKDVPGLAPSSNFLRTRIVGTASAKLSYLVTQVLKFFRDEKIIIFYDGKNTAYYIAQMLELLHVKHEIYDTSLPANLKSQYVVRFDQEPEDRVLLMDIKQAAFGLNISSASRIYFVNPVCRPDIEAQAIKRAHRFGQTRPVYVETLVLRGTIEEKMLERSKRMTRAEHADVSKLEDDNGIREIIQSARLLPVDIHEPRIARLEEPQQLWARQGWRDSLKASEIKTTGETQAATTSAEQLTTGSAGVKPEDSSPRSEHSQHARKKQKKTVVMVNHTNHSAAEQHVLAESPEDGRLKKRARVDFDGDESRVVLEERDDTSEDEPLRSRWLRVPSPITPPVSCESRAVSSLIQAPPAIETTREINFHQGSPHLLEHTRMARDITRLL